MAGRDLRIPELSGGVDIRTLPLTAIDGFVLSRETSKYVTRGAGIMKIVGTQVLPARKGAYLLED